MTDPESLIAQRETTLRLARRLQWPIVLLLPKSKKPSGLWKDKTYHSTKVLDNHLSQGGNLGLVCGKESGIVVLDFDIPEAFDQMSAELGILTPTVITGSGKIHCYFKWEDNLPAKIIHEGFTVGEVQRGPNQYVVCPPSIHPSGGMYRWVGDPRLLLDLPPVPLAWRGRLVSCTSARPSWVAEGDTRGTRTEEPWTGPDAETLILRALTQPGGRRRSTGVKFQCPACRAEGHDKSRDNALVAYTGRWGCAYDPSHKLAIGVALGAFKPPNVWEPNPEKETSADWEVPKPPE